MHIFSLLNRHCIRIGCSCANGTAKACHEVSYSLANTRNRTLELRTSIMHFVLRRNSDVNQSNAIFLAVQCALEFSKCVWIISAMMKYGRNCVQASASILMEFTRKKFDIKWTKTLKEQKNLCCFIYYLIRSGSSHDHHHYNYVGKNWLNQIYSNTSHPVQIVSKYYCSLLFLGFPFEFGHCQCKCIGAFCSNSVQRHSSSWCADILNEIWTNVRVTLLCVDTWIAFNEWHIQLGHEQVDVNATESSVFFYILIRLFQSDGAEAAQKEVSEPNREKSSEENR